MRLLVTGGCGFAGSHFIHFILEHYQPEFVTNVDALTYAGNLQNVASLKEEYSERYDFFEADIANREAITNILSAHKFYAIINFAAESHVDRSIYSPEYCIHSNIVGTSVLLELARKLGVQRFIQISTDEVYGPSYVSAPCDEKAIICPSSPYSASKAAADILALAAWQTYRQETLIVRGSNLYGERQHPENLIPKAIIHAINNQPIPIYGNGEQTRQWLHVTDFCRAIASVLFDGKAGEIYNVGGETTLQNLDLVKQILKFCKRSESLIQHVEDRAGHDPSYAMNCNKIKRELRWAPIQDFKDELQKTIDWYRSNRTWWKQFDQ